MLEDAKINGRYPSFRELTQRHGPRRMPAGNDDSLGCGWGLFWRLQEGRSEGTGQEKPVGIHETETRAFLAGGPSPEGHVCGQGGMCCL